MLWKPGVIESNQQDWQWGKLAAGLNSNSSLSIYMKQGKKSEIRTRLGRCTKVASGHNWHFAGVCLIQKEIILMLPFFVCMLEPISDPFNLAPRNSTDSKYYIICFSCGEGWKARDISEWVSLNNTVWCAHGQRDGTVHSISHWMLQDLGKASSFTAAKAQHSGWDKWATLTASVSHGHVEILHQLTWTGSRKQTSRL